MKICITGNAEYGLASELKNIYPDAVLLSRTTGFDLTTSNAQMQAAELASECDVFVNCSALWKFNQTVLLDTVYKTCAAKKLKNHIIAVGSTTDRVKNGKVWLYNAEKKALRDYCNTLSINSVWNEGPRVTYVSFGTLSNNQQKHPDRKCMAVSQAAQYIKWIIEQPSDLHINEISIDPIQ